MKLIATQSANVSVTFKNANGFPTDTEGEIVWQSSNPAIATVAADEEDDTKAVITAGPVAGSVVVSATADADLGEGVSPVSASLPVEVVARGVAVGGEIDVDSIDQGLPPVPATPGNELPTPPPTAGQGLPDAPNKPSNELPGKPAGKPDNTTPGAKPK